MRNGSFSREYVSNSSSVLSPPLSPSFKIRQTFATLFENSLLPPFTLENTRPPLLHPRSQSSPPLLFTHAFPISSLFSIKKKKKKKTNRTWLHFAFVDSSDRNISTEIIYMRVFVRISCLFRKKKEEGKKSVRS